MDITQRHGNYPPPAGSSMVLGVEFSGQISELGPGVSGWKLDDEVMGLAGGVSVTNSLRACSTTSVSVWDSVFLPTSET